MATKIFSIANQKGGVGKTTTSVNLAAGLAKKGKKVLLIDLDPQANATSALGLEKKEGASLFGVMCDNENINDKIVHFDQKERKNLSIITSEVDMATVEMELGKKENYLSVLKNVLDPIKKAGTYDAIIIDCPPALGMLSMNALAASDYLLIALQCEYLAMEGLGQILSVLDLLKNSGATNNLKLGGIIMTMYDSRTNLSKQVFNEVKDYLPKDVFNTVIPRTVRLSEAPSFGKTIFEYSWLSSASRAYDKLSKELIKKLL